ncbi:PAS domain S-box-containing protein [Halopseudomonas litoralis]|uniref:histidine kinase n=1 Tax=Halopseudomonas litoralis TaxID=797277 RepID=A0A1H1TF04_9GAMM|nr:PAS domain-containing protein [Halopseudomonas litoralis]SDS58556.1 PAS domain S-box-containing protein [Halopseudomonas litoralis]
MLPKLLSSDERLLRIIGAALLGLLFAFFAWSGQAKRDQAWEAQFATHAQMQRLAVQQSQHAIRRQALMAAQSVAADPDTQELIRQIERAVERDGIHSPALLSLRSQLQQSLGQVWRVLKESGADQLHIHLSPDVISLLRMHQSDAWGDELAAWRPMADRVQRTGIPFSGLSAGRYGVGIRAIVPVFAVDNDDRVVASVEVGFGIGSALYQLDNELQASLAVLINTSAVQDLLIDQSNAGQLRIGGDSWSIERYSQPSIVQWLQENELPHDLVTGQAHRVQIDDRQFLLTPIPLQHFSNTDNDAPPHALMLTWRDITPLWNNYANSKRLAPVYWGLSYLASLALMGALMLGTRHMVRSQERARQRALLEEAKLREANRKLSDIIVASQSAYITEDNRNQSFDRLLEQILELSDSQFGFIGQVLRDEHAEPYLKVHAISDISWDMESAAILRIHGPQGMIFRRLDTLFGQVLLTGDAYLSNDAAADPNNNRLPPGHPPLQTFAGLPIYFGEEMIGMLALANRSNGYDDRLVEFLAPLLSSLGQLIHALVKDRQEHITARRLEHQRQALRAMNEIAGVPELDVTSQLKQVLELGCRYLGMDMGIVSRITGDDYLVVAQHSKDAQVTEGEHFPLGRTYCALTLQQQDVLSIQDLEQSPYSGHLCDKAFDLRSYISVSLMVGDERYGTLSFSSSDPRLQPFEEPDMEFVRLLGPWVSEALRRDIMQQEREQLLARFEKLTTHLPGVIYQYQLNQDRPGWFPYCSKGLEEIFGTTPEQAQKDAENVLSRIHAEDRQGVTDSIRISADNLDEWQSEFRVEHPLFGERWVAGVASPEALEDGTLVWHGFAADITQRKQMEMTLELERARLASIIRGAILGTWEWNVQTGETFYNELWYDINGYTPEELQPTEVGTWRGLIHPEDRAEADRVFQAHFDQDLDYIDFRYRIRHRDRHWVWVHDRGQLIRRDTKGLPLWVSGICTDITEDIQRDTEIRQARAFLRAVIDASTEVAVIATDLDGIITLFNTGASNLLGYRADEMIGKHTPTCFHLDSELGRRAQILSTEHGHPIDHREALLANARRGQPETLPWIYIHKDRSQRLVNLTVTGIRDQNDELTGFLGVATDMTELIQATRELQRSETHFRNMVSTLPGAVYRCAVDESRTITYLSSEIEAITGYPAEDFINNRIRSYLSILHPDDVPSGLSRTRALAQHESFELTYRIIHAEGHEIWIRDKGRGEYDAEGRLLWISGFIWDVTERYRIEQMKTEFVSTVSHELRTPLTAISGALRLLEGGALGELPNSMRKMLGIALNNSRTLTSLVNDLLDLDKLAANRMHFDIQRLLIKPLLSEALDANRAYADQFNVTLRCGHVDPVLVNVDPRRLGQVLANYLSNAAKFSHEGGTVTLDARYAAGRVRISVTDEGEGIPPEAHDRLFERFSQMDSSTTRRRGGTGLGLAVTKDLVEHMGGQVGFESAPDKGSTFWCELDAEPVDDVEA